MTTRALACDSRAAAKSLWDRTASSGFTQPSRSSRTPALSPRNAAHICSSASGNPNSKIEPVETDACGRTATPGVFACGDVASWWRPSLGRHLRVEHWTSAAGQGAAVARAILGRDEPYDEPPYFRSDQFGLRLQHVGHAETWTRVDLEGDETSFVARYLDAEGRTLAALAANRQAEVGALRRELAAA